MILCIPEGISVLLEPSRFLEKEGLETRRDGFLANTFRILTLWIWRIEIPFSTGISSYAPTETF
ncbi:hypothetical protein JWG45_13595 [Leptospira sp. 201903070]|jgi:hypothetical protein|uniref:Uncharacterized protein n=1 Tax=Leptospira ainlahdjerensis TaxID=2810033 RepID=A0ABS2UCT3_9LEPT|nr:hypothetical protein [Leptospira ainlahdjerensis]MBM9578186.1 hypothetical protein [Leptospira ainlahdjerensis]